MRDVFVNEDDFEIVWPIGDDYSGGVTVADGCVTVHVPPRVWPLLREHFITRNVYDFEPVKPGYYMTASGSIIKKNGDRAKEHWIIPFASIETFCTWGECVEYLIETNGSPLRYIGRNLKNGCTKIMHMYGKEGDR